MHYQQPFYPQTPVNISETYKNQSNSINIAPPLLVNGSFPVTNQKEVSGQKTDSVQNKMPAYDFKTINFGNQRKEAMGGTRTVSNYQVQSSNTVTIKQDTWSNNQTIQNKHGFIAQSFVKNYPSQEPIYQQKTKQIEYNNGSSTPRQINSLQPTPNPHNAHEAIFKKYAAGDHSDDPHSKYQAFLKDKLQATSGSYMTNYYQSLVEPTANKNVSLINQIETIAKSQSNILPSESSSLQAQRSQEEDNESNSNRSKISELNQKITTLGFEKNELLLEVAQANRQNSQLRKVNQQLKQQIQTHKATIQAQKDRQQQQNSKGIFLQFELIAEIENIRERQTELSKLKKEFMSVIEEKYQEEMKRLAHQNTMLKKELQTAKFQLDIAKQSAKQKQAKLDFMQRQNQSLENKSDSMTKNLRQKAEWQVSEKDKQIQALKHSLAAIEKQYRAQRKEIADKDEFIMKYMAGTGEDIQTVQLLLDKYNFYSRKQFEQQTKYK